MPKNIGDHEEPSIFGVDEPTVPEAIGEEPVVEDVPRRGPQEHGKATDSLTVVRTQANDDGEPATPSEPPAAPKHTSSSHTAHKPGPRPSGNKSTGKSGDDN